ncbi:hemolysin family protein [Opitutaceae bacterium]|nr:hemolysin family protein [Opitutaceae bacterium]
MINSISNELVVLLLLLLTNGIFALAEAALGAARKSRLRELADEGTPHAAEALRIVGEPSNVMTGIRVAIIFVTVLAGARAGGAATERVLLMITETAWLQPIARPVSLGLVALAVTLVLVFFADFLPRRLARMGPERIAMLMVRPMRLIAFVLSPIVVGLSALTELVLWPFGLHRAPKEAPVTEEEVNTLVEEGMKGGVFNESERDMVAGVLELDEIPVTYLTTPRPKLVFLDLADPDETNWCKVVASGHSHFPVVHGNKEQVIGMVSVKAMWANQAFGVPTSLRHLLTSPLIVPENMAASVVLEQFKRSGQHIALVNDEFGALAGVVTLYDVLEAIVGDIPESGRQTAPEVTTRPDGSLLMDATFEIDEFKELTKFDHLPHEEETEFQTVGGFVLTHFGRIPRAGDSFQFEGWQFEVMDMDRQRIDKILVSPPPKDTTKEPSEDTAGGI